MATKKRDKRESKGRRKVVAFYVPISCKKEGEGIEGRGKGEGEGREGEGEEEGEGREREGRGRSSNKR